MSGDKKFIISIMVISIILLVGAVFFASKMGTSNSASSAPISDNKKNLLEVASDDYVKGNKEASVTLIEYLDFECEACGAYYPLMKQLSEEFKADVRFVNRYFPLPGHKNGMNAALAVEAANKQDKYWEMHNLLFENQKTWGEKQTSDPTIFEGYAKQIGLNLEQFKKDVSSKEVKNRVERDKSSGQQLGVSGTPSFFLDGEKLQNPRTPDDFKTLLKAAILKAPKPSQQVLGEKVHEHADLKVYLNGKQLDLTQAKYQSTEDKEIDPDTHLHDGNGDIVHKHRKGITLGYFLKTLKIDFSKDCLVLDTGERYCSGGDNELKFRINDKPNDQFNNYEFSDLDRILISFGPKQEEISKQMQSVTDIACMYSEKCPERGTPPTEKCVGGLGDDC